jgi:hypothetical protein
MRSRNPWLFALVLAAAACNASGPGPDPVLSTAGYDHSCSVDMDCMVVATGDLCPCCGSTGLDAINRSELGRYAMDRDSALTECHSRMVCTEDCVSGPPAACVAHVCTICPLSGCVEDAGADAVSESEASARLPSP